MSFLVFYWMREKLFRVLRRILEILFNGDKIICLVFEYFLY